MRNKKEEKAYNKAYYQANKEKILIRHNAWNEAHKEKVGVYSKVWRKVNSERIKSKHKVYQEKNRELLKIKSRVYYRLNKDSLAAKGKIYREANKDKIKDYNRIWQRNKRKTDIKYNLNATIRTAICISLKGNKNGKCWQDIVGYTLKDLKKHLEKQFTEGMSWSNRGKDGWHIDHKIPISAFNFTQPDHEDFKRCWALSNLQPLWESDNMSKQARLDKPFQPSLLM